MSDRRRWPWVLAVALALGAWVRLDQLLIQVPADDEWHALRAALGHDFAWIFSHFGFSDYSIPLALYDKLLAETLGLGELGLRLPMLVSGLASIVVMPLLVRPLVGTRAAAGLAILIALSPILVYYSRYARPYAPATLAAFTAIIAAWRWREAGGRPWAALYGACAVLAAWLLPVLGPLVLAPWAVLFAESLLRRQRAPHPPRSLLLLGVAIGAGLVVLLGLPVLNDLGSLTEKMAAGGGVSRSTLRKVASLYTGTGYAGPRLAVLATALLGGALLLRRAPSLVAYLVAVFGLQVVALLLADPIEIGSGITLGRYLLPLQPFLLLGVAVALGSWEGWLTRDRLPAPVLAAVCGGLLFLVGPLPGVLEHPNSFTNHAWHQYDYSDADRARASVYWGRHRKRLPEFFHELAERERGSVHLLEAPWLYPWYRIKMREAQAVHGQHVAAGFLGRGLNPGNELPLGDRFQFRTFVEVGDHDEVVRRGFDYVVFHNDLTRELKKGASLQRIGLGTHLAEYTERFGPPVFEDKRLTVFAVR